MLKSLQCNHWQSQSISQGSGPHFEVSQASRLLCKFAGSASGSWELPYLADENADEDPELRVAPSKEGQAETRLKQAFLGASKQVSEAPPPVQSPCEAIGSNEQRDMPEAWQGTGNWVDQRSATRCLVQSTVRVIGNDKHRHA